LPKHISGSGIGEVLRYDLKLVFVNDISNAIRLQHPNRNSVMFQDYNQFADAGKMFMSGIFEPRDRLILLPIERRLGSSKARRLRQMRVEPLNN
jgi:hypothetical protein